MKRIYGNTYTKLNLSGKALEAYNNMMNITIIEYTDKAYKVLPEYQHLWGNNCDNDTIIWDCDLGWFASEWDTTESDLLDQLEEFMVYDIPGYVDHLMTEEELIKWLEDGML